MGKNIFGLLFILLLIFSTSFKGMAQQKPVYSQYMFNHLAINPAYAGNQKQLYTTGLYRKQWENFEGAPETLTFSAHSALPDRNVGVGLLIAQDKIGVHNYLDFYASYAYQIRFRKGMLAMGLQAGFTSINSDYPSLNGFDENDTRFSQVISKFAPNFGTGIFYSTRDMYIGISVPMMIKNQYRYRAQDIEENFKNENRFYFITAGKIFTLNQMLKMKPSTLISYQKGNAVHVDVNLNFIFDEVLWAGVSYRHTDAVVFMSELQVSENFRFGYAYDWVTSDIRGRANGSHELMLNYRINLTKEICHTYF